MARWLRSSIGAEAQLADELAEPPDVRTDLAGELFECAADRHEAEAEKRFFTSTCFSSLVIASLSRATSSGGSLAGAMIQEPLVTVNSVFRASLR
jgi:hypothetical protein